MKHGVSDATIYPLRMLASAILRGLKRFFFSYGCVSGFRGHQDPSVESRTEQRARLGARGETSETMHPVEQPAQPDAGT